MSIKERNLVAAQSYELSETYQMFSGVFTGIYIQSKAEQAGLSVNEFCHQAAMDCQVCQRISPEIVSAIRDLPVSPITSIRLPINAHLWIEKQSNNNVFRLS